MSTQEHDESTTNGGRSVEQLRALLEITRGLAAETSLDRLLQLIVTKTSELLDAERSSLWLVDHERQEIWTKAAQLSEIAEIRLPLSAPGLAPTVARTGETINLADAYDDPRFNRNLDKATGWRTRSMLVTPMIDHRGDVIGVFQVMNKRSGRFGPEDEELLESFAASAGIAVENAQNYDERQKLFDSILATMAASIEAKDTQTLGHTDRVTAYSVAIARAYGLSPAEVEIIRLAALLHDYGKIAIPDAILGKSSRLTDEEFRTMREHARQTKLILSKIRFPRDLVAIPDIASQHHERPDGRGYPWGLKGEEITLGARIIAVADVFDALSSRRFYKDAMPIDQVVKILHDGAGTQFDPTVVNAFDLALPDIQHIFDQQRERILAGT